MTRESETFMRGLTSETHRSAPLYDTYNNRGHDSPQFAPRKSRFRREPRERAPHCGSTEGLPALRQASHNEGTRERFMHRREFLTAAAVIGSAAPIFGLPGLVHATQVPRISGPYTHENLSLYFTHGPSAPGPVPLTLQEALAKNQVLVRETGDVNQLVIENRGNDEVFVQAGEIVKGGKQDRVLTVSVLLPKNSGPVPIGAYCVEQGRWQPRGKEDASRFSTSDAAVPSRKAKLAMKAPPSESDRVPSRLRHDGSDTGRRQQEVWKDVAETQRKLAGTVGAPVAAPESRSSLQLSLENKQVQATVAAYVKAL